jgi:hypothetical protein
MLRCRHDVAKMRSQTEPQSGFSLIISALTQSALTFISYECQAMEYLHLVRDIVLADGHPNLIDCTRPVNSTIRSHETVRFASITGYQTLCSHRVYDLIRCFFAQSE